MNNNRFCSKCGNQVEQNAMFCNKCGIQLKPITNIQTFNTSQINNQTYTNDNNKIKMILIGFGSGIIVLIVVFIFVLLFDKSDYYFSNENYEENEVITQTSSNNTNANNKYRTVIITDNFYSGVKISNRSDALKLITEDSVNQKNNCPSEIKKIEEQIIKDYGITAVNLCELDIEYAKEMVNVLETVYKEYPSIKGYITNFSITNTSMSQNYIAAFMASFIFAASDSSSGYPWVIKTQILLNSTYFLNIQKLESGVKSSSEVGHFPKNATKYSPVAHEFGHYISFLAMMKSYNSESILLIDDNNIDTFYNMVTDHNKGVFSLSMIQEAYNNYKKDTNTTLSLDEWRGTISSYALAKNNSGDYLYDETIAESFHDVYLNGDNAADASKYVIAVLKKRLGS